MNGPEFSLGPIPKDSGAVEFLVHVDGLDVVVSASPLGIGVSADVPVPVGNTASAFVAKYIAANGSTMTQLYRDAARLRKSAGNPPLLGDESGYPVSIRGQPQLRGRAVLFRVDVHSSGELRVLIFPEGGIIDDCDDWDGVTDAARRAAIRAVLNWVFANSAQVKFLGLDLDLLRDFWG